MCRVVPPDEYSRTDHVYIPHTPSESELFVGECIELGDANFTLSSREGRLSDGFQFSVADTQVTVHFVGRVLL